MKAEDLKATMAYKATNIENLKAITTPIAMTDIRKHLDSWRAFGRREHLDDDESNIESIESIGMERKLDRLAPIIRRIAYDSKLGNLESNWKAR